MSELEWSELSDAWRRDLGTFDDVAGYNRLQLSRGGFALLLLQRGSPVAFVKLRHHDCGGLWNEMRALEAVWKYRPRAFQVPEPFRSGTAAGWCYLASAPLLTSVHRPPRNPPVVAILREVVAALAGLPRPAETPDHWRPMHGDFAPWNLRQLRGGSLVLIDWEDAGWAPPGADEVLYGAASAALAFTPAARCDAHEAVQFWRERVVAHPETARDQRLTGALLQALDRMVAA